MKTRSGLTYNFTEKTTDDSSSYYTDLGKQFQRWKKDINNLVLNHLSISCDDLPDIDYYSLFVENITAEQVSRKLIHDYYIDMLN